MSNPYQSPASSLAATTDADAKPHIGFFKTAAFAALVMSAVSGPVFVFRLGLGWAQKYVVTLDSLIANMFWNSLVLSIFVFVALVVFRKRSAITEIFQLAVAVNGLTMLVTIGSNVLAATQFGTGYEQFAFRNRVLGSYAWYFWLVVVSGGIWPLAFFFPVVRRRLFLTLPVTLVLAVYSALYLRVDYLIYLREGPLPSSWRQFFGW